MRLRTWREQIILSEQGSFEGTVRIRKGKRREICAERESILKLVGVLPVEDISLFDHIVDVVLNVPNERNLVYVQLLKEVYKLFLNTDV